MIPDASPAFSSSTARRPAAEGAEKVIPTPTPRTIDPHQTSA